MSDEIEVLESQIYFKPYGEGLFFRGPKDTYYNDGLVHIVTWYLRHPRTGKFLPQYASCYGMFRGGKGALEKPEPVTCLFCLGWYGQPPQGCAINMESLHGVAGQP